MCWNLILKISAGQSVPSVNAEQREGRSLFSQVPSRLSSFPVYPAWLASPPAPCIITPHFFFRAQEQSRPDIRHAVHQFRKSRQQRIETMLHSNTGMFTASWTPQISKRSSVQETIADHVTGRLVRLLRLGKTRGRELERVKKKRCQESVEEEECNINWFPLIRIHSFGIVSQGTKLDWLWRHTRKRPRFA